MKRLMTILLLSAALFSCSREGDYSNLSGRWYPVSDDCLVDKFIELSSGNISTYISDYKYPADAGFIWNCTEDTFYKFFSGRYSVIDGKLISGADNFGDIMLRDGELFIDGCRYVRLEGFNSAFFSTIAVDGQADVELDGQAFSGEIGFKLENAVSGYTEVGYKCDCDWIYNCFIKDGKLRFSVSEFTSGGTDQSHRSGSISLYYRYAETVRINITQTSLF